MLINIIIIIQNFLWGTSYGLFENVINAVTFLFIFWNIISFIVFWIDKRKAINNKWRISENLLIFFILTGAGIGSFLSMKLFRHKTKKTKFKIANIFGLILASIVAIHIINGYTLGRMVAYREHIFYSSNWPVELNGYRIAFLTDKHRISNTEMRQVIDELNNRNIDLLLLGGDFSMTPSDENLDGHYIGTLREISRSNAKDGIWGVEGNHDYFRRLFVAKEYFGIGVLDNSGLYIHQNFFLAGVHDMWNREPDIQLATSGANNDSFVLVISHNPDVSMRQNTQHVDLIFSGHTHGGQVTFFGWPFYLYRRSITKYSTRFAHGFAESVDGRPVFTSSGIGAYYVWPRTFNRPEAVIFTMYNK